MRGPAARAALLAAAVVLATPSPARADGAAALAEGEALFARRAEGASGGRAQPSLVDQALAAYRRALAEAPQDLERLGPFLRALHFRGAYCGAGEEEQRRFFDEGRRLGQAAVDRLEQPLEKRPAAERLAALRQVPGAAAVYYWTCANWGGWALTSGKLAAARQGVAGRVRDLAQTVVDLDPQLDEGGGHRVLGRLHDQSPRIPFVTGWVSKQTALEQLRRALALGPESRTTWLFLAEAILDHDRPRRAEALALLQRCLDSPPRPEHAVEDAHYCELARAVLRERR